MENRLMNLDGSRPIMENWDELNEGFAKTEAELDAAAAVSDGIKAEVTEHKDSSAAHSAEHITYSGAVAGAGNIQGAVDSVKQQLDTAVMAGDSSVAADQASIDVEGVKHPSLKARIDKDVVTLSEQLADIAYNPKQFGAKLDGVTADTQAFRDTIVQCKLKNKALYIPDGVALITGSLNVTGIRVFGNGFGSVLKASGEQFDLLVTNGNTILENFYIDGGWDRVTFGLNGNNILVDGPYENPPYNCRFSNIKMRNSKKNGIQVNRGGYSSFEKVDCRVSGGRGLALEANSGADSVTTFTFTSCVFSDCPDGYGIKVVNGVNLNFIACIVEFSKGMEIDGADNRNINLIGTHIENSSTNQFLTLTGSGMNCNVIGCYGGTSQIQYNPNFLNTNIFGNTMIEVVGECYNWSMVQYDNKLSVSELEILKGLNIKNEVGVSNAHILDTVLLPNASDVILSLRNNGNETHQFKAAGGFKAGADWQFGHLELGEYHLWIDANSSLRIKGSAPTSGLDGNIVPKWVNVPSSPTSFGIEGQMAKNSTYLYICTQNSNWTRIALTSW